MQGLSTARHRWKVLLDAAAFLPAHPLNLTDTPADHVCISFYKLFGYSTGVGAWVARKEDIAAARHGPRWPPRSPAGRLRVRGGAWLRGAWLRWLRGASSRPPPPPVSLVPLPAEQQPVPPRTAWPCRKVYWGGGSVFLATSRLDWKHYRPQGPERFEDGTLPFLNIMSLHQG